MDSLTDSIGDLQRSAVTIQVADLIAQNCDPKFIAKFNNLVSQIYRRNRLVLGMQYNDAICDHLAQIGIKIAQIDDYCHKEFGDCTSVPFAMLDVLACIFCLDIGVSWVPGQVSRLCKGLIFDDDRLLTGPKDDLNFRKDGVYYKDGRIIPYHDWLGYTQNSALSYGFIDTLVHYMSENNPSYFGLRISEDRIIDATRHRELFTRAYIYGPKGISLEQLQDPRFPEDPTGTVTVHEQGDHDTPLARLFPLGKTEVMWSYKGDIKTVQIEELVTAENMRAREGNRIRNRYVHARWDTNRMRFVHFDGAVRAYDERSYDSRVSTNIKKSGKHEEYIKLFRVDGSIQFDTWAELCVKFFSPNDLVYEYLQDNFSNSKA